MIYDNWKIDTYRLTYSLFFLVDKWYIPTYVFIAWFHLLGLRFRQQMLMQNPHVIGTQSTNHVNSNGFSYNFSSYYWRGYVCQCKLEDGPFFLSTVQFVFAPNKKQHNIFVCYLIEVLTTSICIVRGNYTVNENFEWFYVWSIYSQILIIRSLKLNNVFKCLDIAFCILYNFNYDS